MIDDTTIAIALGSLTVAVVAIDFVRRKLTPLPSYPLQPRRKAIATAIKHGWDLEIEYTNKDKSKSKRRVSPKWLGATAAGRDSGDGLGFQHSILFAYCHRRKEGRHFRIDRMKTLRLIGDDSQICADLSVS